ncbi:MBL fold metallo-hydrolase [Ectobacillus antri]|jgi:glyoxylase-like metal-dependent hydrolase (beta-lactamase superfamily II)|uniref:MBL fold metallo-hydrolase n=1 Tax=Ectobacillus antri TaxID=2486280 RepID=A0ABT6H6M4_9BACI|nr:MBL fold metallo-hydrolase [Ectobacillus antri]MDG4657138.1 MBL fold metallo-hydrolase [Ectobacillus antri]MDG5754597.1 MBL fold metallo-hydrolase [Ectobacillus antri]
MRITQNGHLFQLAFLPRLFPVNCYLVEEKNELTLIDAALPFSHKGILKAAQTIGKPITRIVLTHAHEDHVGALDSLKRALPNAKVFISERDASIMAHDLSLRPNEPQTPIKGGVPKTLQTRPDVLLHDGDTIGSLTAVAAPGHTPGSMAFLDTRTHALIAGDAFQTRAGVAVAGKINMLFPFPAFGTWDKKTAIASAEKLLRLSPSLLATGHGKMMAAPITHMKQAIAEANIKLGAITA